MIVSLGSLAVVAALGSIPALSAQTPAYHPTAAQSGTAWVPARAAGSASVRQTLSLTLDRVTVREALDAIAREAGVAIGYGEEVIESRARVTLFADGRTVADALTAALHDTGLEAYVSLGTGRIIVRKAPPTGILYGQVLDSALGSPLAGVTVAVVKQDLRATTNDSGYYHIAGVPAGLHVVAARLIGYAPAQMGVSVVDDESIRLDFSLAASVARLDEVVVTATGERRRYELGNAIATIDVDSLVRTQPIGSITDLLETRVPGLTVTHTSGAPGDPARLRLRGLNSVTRSNDPIVILDGVRVYAEQSDARAANLAGVFPWSGQKATGTNQTAAPSPLEQLDPNSIARIEVFKGPSAATLYGADAANGVIVVTSKRGQAGPTRWNVQADYGTTHTPGSYPDVYFRWGHNITTGDPARCRLADFTCTTDSVVTFQALNHPDLTVLGRGHRQNVSVGVSGGSELITYSLTGSFADETGLLKMPDTEVRRITDAKGAAPPDWVQRPHGLDEWHATGRVGFQLSPKADIAFTSTVSRSRQQRSSMDEMLSEMMGMYVDTLNGLYYPPHESMFPRPRILAADFRQTTAEATNFTDALQVNWRPLGWLTATADVGINIIDRRDMLTKARLAPGEPLYGSDLFDLYDFDGTGFFNSGNGNSRVTTVNLGATTIAPLFKDLRLRTAFGGNYTRSRTTDLTAAGSDLVAGAGGLSGAREVRTLEQRSGVTTFGWYIEPTLEHKRFFLSTGLRLDGADTYGSQQSLAGFPKVSLSYLIGEEPFFPLKNAFSTVRLRAAYGQAGVQPGPTDRLRLYRTSAGFLGSGGTVDANLLSNLGNDNLKPERSEEFEAGLDVDLFGQAVTLELTAYRKTRVDALVPVQVPPSVGGGGPTTENLVVLVNIGKVRNTGFEIGLGTNLIRSDLFTFGTQMHLSRNRNVVLSTGEAGAINFSDNTRVVSGFPLFGRWERPILGYDDVNGDGIIVFEEVQIGDQPVYLGPAEPNYEGAVYTNFSLFRGLVTATAGFSYVDGQLQVNETALNNQAILRAANDASAPFGEQAAIAVANWTRYGLAQTTSTFRFNSVALAFNAPPEIAARYFGARTASFTIQGTNLGLWTNYRGKDPSVNAYATGNVVADTGQLPLPRTWSFGVRLGF
jgi:TonB-linked SusC/RagA family outer membrane protein